MSNKQNDHFQETAREAEEETEDLLFEKQITCPKCKLKVFGDDSWEYEDEGDHICDDCGCEFNWQRDIEITYSTYPKK
jgi:hypothetical protein